MAALMAAREFARLLAAYTDARHVVPRLSRADLEARQTRMIARLLRTTLPRSPFYRPLMGAPLCDFPIMTKALMMDNFEAINTAGIASEAAFALTERAEATRDFTPMIGDISVGLSTGTSGRRGLFLVSPSERARWAGVMLGRMLPGPLHQRHRIAFLLRANNGLYESVSGRARIAFRFFDLKQALDELRPALAAFQPTILIAPAQVLRALALMEPTQAAHLAPTTILSVAEVLFDDDRTLIERAFRRPVGQVYQCTEGFLGSTCRAGRLHLNEGFVHIEPSWLDDARTRFSPIVTDFCRTTQPIVRYRLDDVLTIDQRGCPCGSSERVIARVEGRADDAIVLTRRRDGALVPLYPDFIARAILGSALAATAVPAVAGAAIPAIDDFRVVQTAPGHLEVLLACVDPGRARSDVAAKLQALFDGHGLIAPAVTFGAMTPADFLAKRRRIRRAASITL